jgi:RNA polymerase sigma-70 factor, ECF subfamily
MPDQRTSSALLQQAVNQDPQAWNRLVSLYKPLIAYWCRRAGLTDEDVNDVVQEVFKAVATDLGNYERAGHSFRAWMRGITRHKIFDFFAHRQGQPAAAGGSDAYQQLQQVPDAAADLADDDQEATALYHRALAFVRGEFEERTWQAFWRTAVDSQTTSSVAVELGMTPGAVRVAKSRVLHRLREEFRDLID